MTLLKQRTQQPKRMIPLLNQSSHHALLETRKWSLVLTASRERQAKCAQETRHQPLKKVKSNHASSGLTAKRSLLVVVLLNQV